jgi:EAL domain-containing protein (putative c-di-GMP-specific phosphodiesterase class I)/GGDEF domain-containing protein
MNLIYYESAVAAFFGLLFVIDLVKRQLPTKRTRTFRGLLCAIMVSAFIGVVSNVAAYQGKPLLVQSVAGAWSSYAELVCCSAFHCYILALSHRLDWKLMWRKLETVLFAAVTVLFLTTPWTKWMFYLTDDGVLRVTIPFRLVCLWLALQLIYDVAMIWMYCKKYSVWKRLFCSVLALPFLAGIAIEAVPHPGLENISVIILFFTYGFSLSMQSPDFFIDSATGAYNRNGFFEMLEERLAYERETDCMLVRVRNFSTMTQVYGEEVLRLVQNRIRDILEENSEKGTVYRIGASTFAVMFGRVGQAEKLYEQVKDKLLREWEAEDEVVRYEYSYYQVSYPQDGTDFEELVQRIHYARSDHEAHHKQGELVRLRHDEVEEAEDKKRVAHLVEEAVMDNSIEIYFQPIYSIEKEKITSLEVLARLKDEDKKYINPEFFIRVAEENYTIIPLGELIFRKACIFASRNHIFDYGIEDININLSPGQCRYEELTDSLVAIAKEYEIPMEKMHLEITESEFTDAAAVGRTLRRLKETGARVALDDFGTGYSTLTNILELPVDYVKIDKSLVWSFAEGENQFLNELMPMIKAEGKKIIAEGIETTEHIEIIKRLQGDFLQGYYFSKPVPEEQFMRFLKEFNQVPEEEAGS